MHYCSDFYWRMCLLIAIHLMTCTACWKIWQPENVRRLIMNFAAVCKVRVIFHGCRQTRKTFPIFPVDERMHACEHKLLNRLMGTVEEHSSIAQFGQCFVNVTTFLWAPYAVSGLTSASREFSGSCRPSHYWQTISSDDIQDPPWTLTKTFSPSNSSWNVTVLLFVGGHKFMPATSVIKVSELTHKNIIASFLGISMPASGPIGRYVGLNSKLVLSFFLCLCYTYNSADRQPITMKVIY